MLNPRVKSLLRPSVRRLKRFWQPPLHRPESKFSYRVLGTDYGGWPVLDDSLDPESIVYCFGVGDDISFDLALIDNFGCAVEAFDPTPRCISWLEKQSLPERFHFHGVGVSDCKTVLSFSAPPEGGFVSYTVAPRTDSPGVVELPVEPLDTLMARLGHSKIHLLKMDIEGSEYAVITDMVKKGIFPQQLCIEFHHGIHTYSPADTRVAVDLLQRTGYILHYVSDGGREYGFHFKNIG